MKNKYRKNPTDALTVCAFLISMLIFIALPANSFAEDDEYGNASLLEVRADPPCIPEQPIPWGLGEEIVLHVSFGIIPAGKAKLEVVDTVRINDQLTYRVVSTARSAKGFDWVYKVRDSIETWIDADSVYSHKFRKRLREGSYKDEKLVLFNLADSSVSWWDDGNSRDPIDVEPFVYDVFAAGFKTRTLPLVVGDTLYIRTHDIKKTYDLFVIVHARETVETLAGSFDCFKCEPIQKSGGLFKKERKARLFVWVTADERRIPVMMTSKASFGTFLVQLESYKPPYYTVPVERPAPPAPEITPDSSNSAPIDSSRGKL